MYIKGKNKRVRHCLFLLCGIVYWTKVVYNRSLKRLTMITRTPGIPGMIYILVAGVRRHIGSSERK